MAPLLSPKLLVVLDMLLSVTERHPRELAALNTRLSGTGLPSVNHGSAAKDSGRVGV